MDCATFRRSTARVARVSFLLLLAAVALPPQAPAQWAVVQVSVAPPSMPYYEQPPMPAAGYIWAPGYWAWDQNDYYWVPGTWVEPPSAGLLWTPGYWRCVNNVYYWNEGSWGEHVGFYGGVNYGYGYAGSGYAGGYWNDGEFSYNSTVNNFGDVAVANSYEQTVVDDNTTNVSFNGGVGGTTAVPTQAELAVAYERRVSVTTEQTQHRFVASSEPQLRASANRGSPPIAATTFARNFHRGGGNGVTGTHFGQRWPTIVQPRQPSWGGGAGRVPGFGNSMQRQPPSWAGGAGRIPGFNRPMQQQQPSTTGAVTHNTVPGGQFPQRQQSPTGNFGGNQGQGNGSWGGRPMGGGSFNGGSTPWQGSGTSTGGGSWGGRPMGGGSFNGGSTPWQGSGTGAGGSWGGRPMGGGSFNGGGTQWQGSGSGAGSWGGRPMGGGSFRPSAQFGGGGSRFGGGGGGGGRRR